MFNGYGSLSNRKGNNRSFTDYDSLPPNTTIASPCILPQKSQDNTTENGFKNEIGEIDNSSVAGICTAVVHATFPSWTNIALMISLIFGGCCANVGGF